MGFQTSRIDIVIDNIGYIKHVIQGF